MRNRKKLFCEINPVFYAISVQKEIYKRRLLDLLSREKFAKIITDEKLPNIISSHRTNMIKRAKDIDLETQENKAFNIKLACANFNGMIIHPSETFSFWKTVGNPSKRRGFKSGRILYRNKLTTGIGGGLCNLANTMHLLILHSPLKVTEFHSHSDALAPDEGKRIPFNSGTSVCYNNVDYRFKNNTDQNVQLLMWCEGEFLHAELRSEREFPWSYRLVEENHHFKKEEEKYYRISKIYKECSDKKNGNIIKKELVLDNHSEVMYDYTLIPEDQIK